jgi:hypothetical protein
MFYFKQVMIGTSKNIWGFDPRSVPGCQLWLDGVDPDGTGIPPANGTTISTWVDKSGNGRNGTASGTPTYSSTSLNGRPAISLGSPNYFQGSLTNTSNTLSVFSFIYHTTFVANDQRVVSLGVTGQNDYSSILYCNPITTYGTTPNRLATSRNNVTISDFGNITPNTVFLTSTVYNGTDGRLYVNGTLASYSAPATSTGNFGYTNYTIGRGAGGGTDYFRGVIGEVLIYHTALTTTERQQIEGYLAHKWGLSVYYIPTIPLSILGCQLWLDGNDPAGTGTQPANGATVSTWVDKSGNGRNATVAPDRIPGTYSTSLRAVNFETSSTGYITTYSASPTNETMFVVFNNPSPTNYNFILIGGVSGARSLAAGYSSGGNGTVGNLNTQVTWLVNTGGYTSGTTALVTSQFTTSTNSISLNGGTAATGGAPGFTAGRVTYLGVDATNPIFYYQGYAMEILFYNSVLNTTQRQTIEEYLTKKWGLSSLYPTLPSTHPFYSIKPHLRIFQPIDVSGCQLWLDGADGSTITFSSGSNVSVWTNKGIVSTTATPTRGASANQITYVTVDGYPGVYINNNGSVGYNASTYSQLTIQSNFQNTADYSIFAVVNLSNVAAGELQTIYGNARGASGETRTPNFGAGATLEFNFDGTNRIISSSFIGSGRLQTALISSSSALTAYTNATAYASNTNGFTRVSTDVGPLPIIGGAFGSGNDARFATGYFHEILIYNSVLTTSQRQQIEGYLAHKWGLTGSLPSTHSFSKFPPSSVPSPPAAIATVTLTSLSTSGGTINWTSTNATGYRWYVGTGSGSGQVATGTITNGLTLTATVTYAFVIDTTYYAWVVPYNLDGLGPTTISLPASISSGFSPTSISGCQLWLDGNDPAGTGTQPVNGATVSTWVDKSGNGRNATVAPSRVVGTYSTTFKAVNFATSSTGYITTYSAAPTNETMFVVFNNPSPSGNNNIIIGGVSGARSLGAGFSPNGNGTVGNLNTQVAWLARTGSGSYIPGNTMIVTSKFTTSTNTLSLNGGVNTASGGAPGFTAGRVTYLGVDATNPIYYYVGYAMEILFYNSVLTTLETQKVEGYLAWKWGLTGSLPSGHPYKTVQP